MSGTNYKQYTVGMKKHTHSLFSRIPTIKDVQTRRELGRAHLLVALLALALILTLAMNLMPGYAPSVGLSVTAMILLLFVGVFSLGVAVALYSKRK
jgi:hypothetical protein